MKKLLQLGLIITGAEALTLTAASAKCASGNEAPTEMKCQAGKCGAGKDKNVTKKAPAKGKCGQGKCG